MNHDLITLRKGTYRSIAMQPDALWLSTKKFPTLAAFQQELSMAGPTSKTIALPYERVTRLIYGENTQTLRLIYQGADGNNTRVRMVFKTSEERTQTAQQLGYAAGLKPQESPEKLWKILSIKLFFLFLTIGITYTIAGVSDPSQLLENSVGRQRQRRFIIKIVLETIGAEGVVVVGGLIGLYLVYSLYKRFTNPVSMVIFERA